MKCDISRIAKSYPLSEPLNIDGETELVVVNQPVDALSGEIAEVDRRRYVGKGLRETAAMMCSDFAGDVAFILHNKHEFAVVRPLFSEVVLYYRQHNNCVVFFAEADDEDAYLLSGKFNHRYIALNILNSSYVTHETGFEDTFEVVSGSVLRSENGRLVNDNHMSSILLKSPLASVHDFAEQSQQIRSLILNSVRHKTVGYSGSISVLCSGGLDSSIAALAANAVAPTMKLHLISAYNPDHPFGDERRFVTELAKFVPCEISWTAEKSGDRQNDLAANWLGRSARPCKMAASIETSARLLNLARENGSRIALNGDGGDQLFLRIRASVAAREIMREVPLHKRASVLSGLAIQQRTSIWSMARHTCLAESAKEYRARFFGDMRFPGIGSHDLGSFSDIELAPAANLLRSLPITKAFQYFGMRNAEMNTIAIRGNPVRERKVFAFWPLVRAAIHAQRQFFFWEGRDRSLAREAFRGELPPAIYNRSGKGAGDDMAARFDFAHLVDNIKSSRHFQKNLFPHGLLEDALATNVSPNIAFALVRASAAINWMNAHG